MALRSALDAIAAPVGVLSTSGLMLATNRAWQAAYAPEGEDCQAGENYLDWCRTLGAEAGDPHLAMLLSRVLAGYQKKLVRTCRGGGGRDELRICVQRIERHTPIQFLVLQERVETRALDEAEDRVLTAQLEERERLATDLHDSVGQHLVGLSLGLTRLKGLLAEQPEMLGVLKEMGEELQQAHSEIRTLAFLLQPPWPEGGGGFEAAARELVVGFGRRAGLTATIKVAALPALCRARQLTLFRILQEALVNVHRHARAETVEVHLDGGQGCVLMKVRDDGRGMPTPEGAAPTFGVGILSMRNRLRRFGGDLRIASGQGGTTVVATLPV